VVVLRPAERLGWRLLKILLVDDDSGIREAVSAFLEGSGHEITAAENGVEALRQLRLGAKPAVIVLDMRMPVMNGWEFRQEQLRDASLAGIPVVVCTADEEMKSVPASGFLKKPIDPDELLRTLSRYAA
jgi:CheY-like chemotaxis protein